MPARRRLPILHRAGKASRPVAPVTSTLGLMTIHAADLSYELNEDDWHRAELIAAKFVQPSRSWQVLLRLIHLLFWLAVGLSVAAYVWIIDAAYSFKGYVQVLGTCFAITLLLRFALEFSIRRATMDITGRKERIRVALSARDDGIQLQYFGLILVATWPSIRAVPQDDKNFYLVLAAGSVLPVPQQAGTEVLTYILANTATSRNEA